jgi:TolB-like protein
MSAEFPPSPIDLAHEQPFPLAELEVRPATLEVLAAGRREVLEPRVMQVLVALAGHHGEVVSRDDLIQSCWGGRIVGEDAINRCISRLRRLGRTNGAFDVETVPRVGYRLAELAGRSTKSPPWQLAVAADKPLASLSTPEGPPGETFRLTPARTEAPLVAVLPFDNISGDADLLYFSDGVSEEILQTLSNATGLKVIGRSSSFQFRGRDKGARRVAGELGCSHVLDGSVRRSGARVRISAQLIECGGQTTLWSDRFDRDLSDVFALQDDIAAAVAAALKSTFAPSANAGPVDPVAYDLYLRARASNPGLYGAFDDALLRQATERAPGFAQAWAALAITRAMHAKSGEGARIAQASEEARRAAERALALDPTSGKAYAALALLEPLCGAYAAAEALFEKASAVGPDDVDVLEKYSRWLHGVGRTEAALAHVTHAFRLDPLYHQGANWYAALIGMHGRLEDAYEIWDRARARWPDFDVLVFNPLLFAAHRGDWTRVDALIAHARAHHLNSVMMSNAIDHAQNLRAKRPRAGGKVIALLRKELAETGTVALNPLVVAHYQGLKDEVFDLVEQASFAHLFELGGRLPNGDYGLHVLFNDHMGTRAIRDDPRFMRLCAKLGLCEYWVATGRWPDCADEVSYDFRGEARRLVGR